MVAERFTYADSEALHRAARVLRRRSRRPQGFLLKVLCRVLADTAEKIEAEVWDQESR